MNFFDNSTDHDDVRFRILLTTTGKPTVCCVQWFDYLDYSGTWLDGYWDTQDDAQAALVAMGL